MDKTAQRIAIAETQGYSCNPARGWFEEGAGYRSWYLVKDPTGHWGPLPDYFNDRNAMIAAVLTLKGEPEQYVFSETLCAELDYPEWEEFSVGGLFDLVTAPLDKIAKAYLVATSKWRND